MPRPKTLVFVDVETTGLDEHIHEVIEIAIVERNKLPLLHTIPLLHVEQDEGACLLSGHVDVVDQIDLAMRDHGLGSCRFGGRSRQRSGHQKSSQKCE